MAAGTGLVELVPYPNPLAPTDGGAHALLTPQRTVATSLQNEQNGERGC